MKLRKAATALVLAASGAMAIAGCGATTAISTTVHPNGSGHITWTVYDSASDISSHSSISLS